MIKYLIPLLLLIVSTNCLYAQETFIPFNKNGKSGLKNTTGEILIPAIYEELQEITSKDEICYYGLKDGFYDVYVINETHHFTKINDSEKHIEFLSGSGWHALIEGMGIYQSETFLLVDSLGTIFYYDFDKKVGENLVSNHLKVGKNFNGRYALFNDNKKLTEYVYAKAFACGDYFGIQNDTDDRYQILDKNLSPKYPFKVSHFTNLNGLEDVYVIYLGRDSTGIFSKNGKINLPPQEIPESWEHDIISANKLDYLNQYNKPLKTVYIVVRNGKKGVIDLYGEVLLPFEYDHIVLYHSSKNRFVAYKGKGYDFKEFWVFDHKYRQKYYSNGAIEYTKEYDGYLNLSRNQKPFRLDLKTFEEIPDEE